MSGSSFDTLRVRPLHLDDIDQVVAIEEAASPEPWSKALFQGEFTVDPASRHWLVAVDDDQVIAFAGMMFVGDEGHLMNVAVRPEWRRRGVARALCGELFDDARARGINAITLEVRQSNESARELYRGFGFVPVGSRPDYYRNADGSTEAALILWLHDVADRRFASVPAVRERES